MVRGKGGRSWSIPPSTFAKNIGQAVVNHQWRLTIEMPKQITIHAPVDTGRFKANNIVSIDLSAYYSLDYCDKDGHETLVMGEAILAAFAPYSVVYIQNNLIYAGTLGGSHPSQTPAGTYDVSSHSITARCL